MSADKMCAEQIANEYAPKNTSKIVALRKLDAKAKMSAAEASERKEADAKKGTLSGKAQRPLLCLGNIAQMSWCGGE